MDYETGIEQQKQGMMNDYGRSSRQGLADRIAGVKRSANARGLLYSGLNLGQQAKTRSDAAAGMADNVQQLNADQQNKLANMNQQQVQFGLQKQQIDQDKANAEYRRAFARRQQELQTAQQLGGTAGGLLGMALPF